MGGGEISKKWLKAQLIFEKNNGEAKKVGERKFENLEGIFFSFLAIIVNETVFPF